MSGAYLVRMMIGGFLCRKKQVNPRSIVSGKWQRGMGRENISDRRSYKGSCYQLTGKSTVRFGYKWSLAPQLIYCLGIYMDVAFSAL